MRYISYLLLLAAFISVLQKTEEQESSVSTHVSVPKIMPVTIPSASSLASEAMLELSALHAFQDNFDLPRTDSFAVEDPNGNVTKLVFALTGSDSLCVQVVERGGVSCAFHYSYSDSAGSTTCSEGHLGYASFLDAIHGISALYRQENAYLYQHKTNSSQKGGTYYTELTAKAAVSFFVVHFFP